MIFARHVTTKSQLSAIEQREWRANNNARRSIIQSNAYKPAKRVQFFRGEVIVGQHFTHNSALQYLPEQDVSEPSTNRHRP